MVNGVSANLNQFLDIDKDINLNDKKNSLNIMND